jgi:hypothetical protein
MHPSLPQQNGSEGTKRLAHSRRRQGEHDTLSSVEKLCVVSFTDSDGFRHSVSVVAESLYEAASLAARSLTDAGCPPTQGTELEIEVKAPAVTHTIKLNRVQAWVNGVARSPADKILKDRLKDLLSAVP